MGKRGGFGKRAGALRLVLAAVVVLAPLGSPTAAPAARSATDFQYPLAAWRALGFGFGDSWIRSCGGASKRHTGVDVAARAGDTVRAVANGRIVGVLLDRTGPWGYTMLVAHSVPGEGTVISRYGHVRPRSGYREGRSVSKGEAIAAVYNLGGSTHLALGIHMGAYTRWAWRGALPRTACGGDPAFPFRFVDPTRYLRVHMDHRAPRTTVRADRSIAAADAAWTSGVWTAGFTCRDDLSGCAQTTSSLDGAPGTIARTMRLDAEGSHVIAYHSIDVRGNREVWRSIVLGVDRTAPTAHVEPATFTVFRSSSDVHLEAEATDAVSGSPAGASGIRGVRFALCPERRASDAQCSIVAGNAGSGGWTSDPHLGSGAYEAWALAEDGAANVGRSNVARLLVLGS